jgi:hypothetical protein
MTASIIRKLFFAIAIMLFILRQHLQQQRTSLFRFIDKDDTTIQTTTSTTTTASSQPPSNRENHHQRGEGSTTTSKVPENNMTLHSEEGEIDKRNDIQDFERQEDVVIATKIHGEAFMPQLIQSLCLLTQAYNRRMQYPIVVFHSEPLKEESIHNAQTVTFPANITFVLDEKTLRERVEALNETEQKHLLERCSNVSGIDELFWWTRCNEPFATTMPLSYNWQSEFRAKHVWRQKALEPYRYMLWMDSDGMCTEVWKQDPVATAIRNDLVILFDNFPQGRVSGPEIHDKIYRSLNKSICAVQLKDGHLQANEGDCPNDAPIAQVHGFFHITNLDFFRSEASLRWTDELVGDSHFSRRWDDQIAVTVSPAVLAPNRSWDMYSHGIKLNVYHNGDIDGKSRAPLMGFVRFWDGYKNSTFPEAVDVCDRWIVNPGR